MWFRGRHHTTDPSDSDFRGRPWTTCYLCLLCIHISIAMAGIDWVSVNSIVCCILAAFNSWLFLQACYGINHVEDHKGFYKRNGGKGGETCVEGADGDCDDRPPRLVRIDGVKVSMFNWNDKCSLMFKKFIVDSRLHIINLLVGLLLFHFHELVHTLPFVI